MYLPKYGPYWCYPGFSETLHCMFTYLRKTVKFVAYMRISLSDKVLFILRNLWPPFFRRVMHKMLFLFLKLIIDIMHFLRYHPSSSTLLARWSAPALLLLINTPINCTFSESLRVPDYCLFLFKNQNINAIQKWATFCESGFKL